MLLSCTLILASSVVMMLGISRKALRSFPRAPGDYPPRSPDQRRGRTIKLALACVAALASIVADAPAMAQNLEKVKFVIPQNSVFVLNWMGARDAGIFRKHDIDLETSNFGASGA